MGKFENHQTFDFLFYFIAYKKLFLVEYKGLAKDCGELEGALATP